MAVPIAHAGAASRAARRRKGSSSGTGALRRLAPTAGDLVLVFVVNGLVVLGLWWRDGGLGGLTGTASALTSAGRLTGLVGTYLILVQLLLVARLPPLERRVGLDRLTVWHRRNGRVALTLLLAHATLIIAGYAVTANLSLPAEMGHLLGSVPGMLTATVGLALLVAVVVVSVRIVRRGLRYETWYFVHLYAYLGLALSFSHQLSSGRAFAGDPVARGYWYVLWGGTLAALVVVPDRSASPVRGAPSSPRRTRHGGGSRRRVDHHYRTRPGPPGGSPRPVLRLALPHPGHWHEAHPFSLSAAPDGRRLRITVKAVGDHSAGLASLAPGTRVLAEGP